MKAIRIVVYLIIVVVVLVFGFWFRYIRKFPKSPAHPIDSNSSALKVICEPVRTSTISDTINVTGTVEPLTSVEVIPEIVGRLERLRLPDGTLIEQGVSVRAGDVVAVIEHAALEASVQQTQAALGVAQASLETTRVTFQDAEREKKRMEGLYQSGAATEQQYDAACTAYDRAKAALEVAKAKVKQAEAALVMAQVALDKATIEAPVTGVVAGKYVDEGNMVGPSKALIKIVQINTLKVVGGVSERYLRQLIPHKTPVHIRTDACPEDEFEGTVYRVGVDVDRVTRTGEVEIRVPNPDRRLKPGMFARMTIEVRRKENVTVVPDSALIRQYDNVYVFVVSGQTAHRRQLKLGLSQGQYYEVLEGLSPGEMVITHGQSQLKDGQEIEVVSEATR